MKRIDRPALPLALAAAVVLCIAFASSTSAATARQTKASCGTFTLAVMAPITGPAASIGVDQLHWPEFFVSSANAKRTATFKLKILQGDDQLNPAKASTIAQQFASTKSVVGVIGPPGSSEVLAIGPVLKKAGLSFISGSATKASLTNGSLAGYFYRVVPNDSEQAPAVAHYMRTKLGVKAGTSVMIVDDQEAYSTGLAEFVQKALAAKGVKVDRESIQQKDTDFSALVAKVTPDVKVVFTPLELAAQTQLFAQQLAAQGRHVVVFGSDGSFDASKFNVSGNYISFFAPDVTTVPADAGIVKAFHRQFPGATSPFGTPNYIAAQVYAKAISSLCAAGKQVTRASVRAAVARVKLPSTLIGPIAFTRNGDVRGAKFYIYKIVNGKYVTVHS
jgi:branched-chain amino acid transport system substrate-binding protein